MNKRKYRIESETREGILVPPLEQDVVIDYDDLIKDQDQALLAELIDSDFHIIRQSLKTTDNEAFDALDRLIYWTNKALAKQVENTDD